MVGLFNDFLGELMYRAVIILCCCFTVLDLFASLCHDDPRTILASTLYKSTYEWAEHVTPIEPHIPGKIIELKIEHPAHA